MILLFSLGPMSIIYLTLGFCLLQCLLFLVMWLLSRQRQIQDFSQRGPGGWMLDKFCDKETQSCITLP